VYRFLLTPRWLAGFALALALAAACVLLGQWQWHRRQERLAATHPITQNYDRPAVPLDDVLARPGDRLPARAEWTPVRVTGRYVADDTLLLRNRPLNGQPGYHVLVPFRTAGGPVLLVDRGWLPTGSAGDAPDHVPAPPAGDVEVTARLREPEPAQARTAPAGQPYTVELQQVRGLLGAADGGRLLTGGYAVLDHDDPAARDNPVALPRPSVDEGPHLSYMFQWYVFAAGMLIGYGVIARRHAEDLRAAGGAGLPTPGAPRPRRTPATRRRPTAEEEEDALLDAAERTARHAPERGSGTERAR
jgi:cytochrome oxidase assembly protein ShyY1